MIIVSIIFTSLLSNDIDYPHRPGVFFDISLFSRVLFVRGGPWGQSVCGSAGRADRLTESVMPTRTVAAIIARDGRHEILFVRYRLVVVHVPAPLEKNEIKSNAAPVHDYGGGNDDDDDARILSLSSANVPVRGLKADTTTSSSFVFRFFFFFHP